MSGHSKWKQIQHQKSANDARRGQVFTRLAREITVAVRHGGANPDSNVRLRLAIQRAKDANMPVENIERAIKRAAGESDGGGHLEEITYEGYGPGGVAILVEAVTDNRNRAAAEVRSTFSRAGGNLGEAGCVSWLFQSRGVITIDADSEDQAADIALAAIDAGAEDFTQDGAYLEIYTSPEQLESLRKALEEQGIVISSADVSMVPNTSVPLDSKTAEQTLRLLDRLEELDDVQKVYSNADFPDEVLERWGKQN